MADGYGPVPFQGQDPTTSVSRQAKSELYANLLTQIQGCFGTDYQIDMVAENGESTPSNIEAGMVVHINDGDGKFYRGLGGGNRIPYFAKPAGGYQGVPREGNVYGDGLLTLPAVSCYKMITNNFVPGNYPANTPLTVIESGDDHGRVGSGAYYEDPIVGIVTRGVLADYDKPGRDVIEFFTYWLPQYGTPYSSYSPGPNSFSP